jgi:hypothetical protein
VLNIGGGLAASVYDFEDKAGKLSLNNFYASSRDSLFGVTVHLVVSLVQSGWKVNIATATLERPQPLGFLYEQRLERPVGAE